MWQMISLSISFVIASIITSILYQIFAKYRFNYKENQFFLYHEKIPVLAAISVIFTLVFNFFVLPSRYLNIENILYLCILALMGFLIDLTKRKIPLLILLIINSIYIYLNYDFSFNPLYLILTIVIATAIIYVFNEIKENGGLAISISILVLVAYCLLFLKIKEYNQISVTFSLIGILLAIKKYMKFPAKLLPGSALSMLIGGLVAIKFIMYSIPSSNLTHYFTINILLVLLPLIFGVLYFLKKFLNNNHTIYLNGFVIRPNFRIPENSLFILYSSIVLLILITDNFIYAIIITATIIIIFSKKIISLIGISNIKKYRINRNLIDNSKYKELEKID